MKKVSAPKLPWFAELPGAFPSTRYQGSKARLADWIWEQIQDLRFTSCLDALGGTGAIAYRLKQAGKVVTYNDLLKFNYYFGRALIENQDRRLTEEDLKFILARHREISYPAVVQNHFKDIYFTDEENAWIDQTIANLRRLPDPYQFALAFFALGQACLIKRPYNLFHRKNLYMRLAEVDRSFGNKRTWDRPFQEWFRDFVQEANQAVFDNGQNNVARNAEASEVPGDYDLVYLDPPYLSSRGRAVDYREFYHFLEGLADYDEWPDRIDYNSKHHRLKPRPNEWTNPKKNFAAFERLFRRYANGIIVVSYRSDGIPAETELVALLKKFKREVRVEHFGKHQYVLSTNPDSQEILLIGT